MIVKAVLYPHLEALACDSIEEVVLLLAHGLESIHSPSN